MKIFSSTYKIFFIIFFICYSYVTSASENQLYDYYKTIRCLVCEGQSIQESDTEFALNLKEQIKKKFDSGISLDEINNELIDIYGEEISYSPSNNHIILWLMPLLLLVTIFFFIRRKYKSN